ncbi:hypothetical protein Pla123a_00110 [Posidoniimonas polymericola]|uniref:Uncharacterized protein n=1 Tax=Posidoniimonas polymericola TaxID=2528002 RepID=A0A5C5ZDF9_9BACT|nr:hypothetical protein [Posidoniimonas polymericola]TWT85205.1 hypothetical protein Pla123a_00110 [Posidoniimonas polymericola]
MFEAAVQALLKLVVMVGIVVVGGMAYHLYGPPAGEASALLDRIVQQARTEYHKLQGGDSPSPAVAVTPLAAPVQDLMPPAPGRLQASELSPVADFSREPMAPLAPLPALQEPAAEPVPESVKQLVSELRALGAEDIQLTPWGAEGAYHRFACCAPLPGETGFVRHFDAIEPNAPLAVARVCDQVRQWRVANPALSR